MNVIATCPHCGHEYFVGVNGTVDGCDDCLGIERTSHGTIIQPGGPDLEIDELTDMEKA